MKTNLKVKIGDITFKNPILVASGTFGYANEFTKFFNVSDLGGIVTKTITVKPRIGNPPQRVFETPSGMLNAIGLQNVGAKRFVDEKLPFLKSLKIPIIVSVMGYSIEEFQEVVSILDKEKGISGFELNLSCPNVSYKTKKSAYTKPKMFAHDASMIEEVVKAVRKKTKKTLIAKLGPDVSDVGQMAMAGEKGGADAISLINTFRAMAIDIKTRKPVLKNVTGGLSGPCVKPVAVRMVWDVFNSVKVPVIGMGGIASTEDVIEFMVAGSSVVQVGTMSFVNPRICKELIDGVGKYFSKNKIKSPKDLIGSLNIDG